jgi:hypothetical protein
MIRDLLRRPDNDESVITCRIGWERHGMAAPCAFKSCFGLLDVAHCPPLSLLGEIRNSDPEPSVALAAAQCSALNARWARMKADETGFWRAGSVVQ